MRGYKASIKVTFISLFQRIRACNAAVVISKVFVNCCVQGATFR